MKPRDALLRSEWSNIESDVRILDVVVVNFGDAEQVIQRSWPDDHDFVSDDRWRGGTVIGEVLLSILL
jgi:hypothetical protein